MAGNVSERRMSGFNTVLAVFLAVLMVTMSLQVIADGSDAYTQGEWEESVEIIIGDTPSENPAFGAQELPVEEAIDALNVIMSDGSYYRPNIDSRLTIGDQGDLTDYVTLEVLVDGQWHGVVDLRMEGSGDDYSVYARESTANPIGANIGYQPSNSAGGAGGIYEDWEKLPFTLDADGYVDLYPLCERGTMYEAVRIIVPEGSAIQVDYIYHTGVLYIKDSSYTDQMLPMVSCYLYSQDTTSDTYLAGETTMVSVNDVESPEAEDGYMFVGFSRTPDGSLDYPLGSSVEVPLGMENLLFPVFEVADTMVTFMSNGSVFASEYIVSGTTVSPPAQPSLEGFTFTGWYTDENCAVKFDFSTPIYSNLTLYAGWEGDLHFTSNPKASMNVTRVIGEENTMRFDASDSVDFMTVYWDFGDGTTSDEVYQEHRYSQPGTYDVTLTVYNDFGHNSITQQVTVGDDGPSGDNGNDEFPWLLVIALVVIVIVFVAVLFVRVF